MIYIIAICLSFLAGFACGSLFYRNNKKKIEDTAEAIKNLKK
jgi:hypothetical protein